MLSPAVQNPAAFTQSFAAKDLFKFKNIPFEYTEIDL